MRGLHPRVSGRFLFYCPHNGGRSAFHDTVIPTLPLVSFGRTIFSRRLFPVCAGTSPLCQLYPQAFACPYKTGGMRSRYPDGFPSLWNVSPQRCRNRRLFLRRCIPDECPFSRSPLSVKRSSPLKRAYCSLSGAFCPVKVPWLPRRPSAGALFSAARRAQALPR